MSNTKTFQKLMYLFQFVCIGGNLSSPANKPKNETKDDILQVENQTINEKFFQTSSNKKILVFKNCKIKTSLDLRNHIIFLINSSYEGKGSYVSVKDQEITFYNITLFSNFLELISIISKNSIKTVKCDNCNFEEGEIDAFIKIISLLHNKNPLQRLNLLNSSYSGDETEIKNRLNEFLVANKISLQIQKVQSYSSRTTIQTPSPLIKIFPTNEDMEEDNSEEEISDNEDENNTPLPKSLEELNLKLEERNIIIPKKTAEQLRKNFKLIKNSKPKSKKEEEDFSYMKMQITTALQLPVNYKIRSDINKIIVELTTKIFRHYFPEGLESVLAYLIKLVQVLVHTGQLDGSNIIFNGPPGVGKTSVTKMIAFLFCLLSSNNEKLPVGKITAALKNEKDFLFLLDFLEANYHKHMFTININGVNDPSFFKGVNRFYVGATMGRILQAFLGLNGLMLIVIDEVDKQLREKASRDGAKGSGSVISTLLNLFDGQQWNDTWFELGLSLNSGAKSGVLFVGTSNDKKNIDDTFLNRFKVIEINAPTNEQKLDIVLNIFIKLCIINKLIHSATEVVIANNSYRIGPFTLDRDVLIYLLDSTYKTDGLRAIKSLIEELFNNVYASYIQHKKNIHITKNNLFDYVTIDEFHSEEVGNSKKNTIMAIFEQKNGNNACESIIGLKYKGNGPLIKFLGGGAEEYYNYQDLAFMLEAILKNLPSLCPNISAALGLSLVVQYFINQQGCLLYQIPSDATELEYREYLIIAIVIASISLIRDINIQPGVVVIGTLLANGEFVVGKGKYQNKIIAATKFKNVKKIVLPIALKTNGAFQGFLLKYKINIPIKYAANLSEVLQLTLVTEEI
jgi:ATP-dependent Lon protease